MLFVYLFLLLIAVSTVLALMDVTVRIPGEQEPLAVRPALSGEGLLFLLGKLVENFVAFPPLGTVLTILLGVGIAERAGLLEPLVRGAFSNAPPWLLPYAAAFVGVSAISRPTPRSSSCRRWPRSSSTPRGGTRSPGSSAASPDAVRDMAGYIVLIFAAAQFIALFEWSNLGALIAVTGAEFLKGIGLTGFAAIVGFIVLASFLNLFIVSGSAMWSLLAPIFVPLFFLLGYEPAFVQAAFRIGDSATQIITPMNPYLLVLLGFVRRYEPGAGLGTLISRLFPYVIPFWVVWVLLLGCFVVLDLPVGPGIHMHR